MAWKTAESRQVSEFSVGEETLVVMMTSEIMMMKDMVRERMVMKKMNWARVVLRNNWWTWSRSSACGADTGW